MHGVPLHLSLHDVNEFEPRFCFGIYATLAKHATASACHQFIDLFNFTSIQHSSLEKRSMMAHGQMLFVFKESRKVPKTHISHSLSSGKIHRMAFLIRATRSVAVAMPSSIATRSMATGASPSIPRPSRGDVVQPSISTPLPQAPLSGST